MNTGEGEAGIMNGVSSAWIVFGFSGALSVMHQHGEGKESKIKVKLEMLRGSSSSRSVQPVRGTQGQHVETTFEPGGSVYRGLFSFSVFV